MIVSEISDGIFKRKVTCSEYCDLHISLCKFRQ